MMMMMTGILPLFDFGKYLIILHCMDDGADMVVVAVVVAVAVAADVDVVTLDELS